MRKRAACLLLGILLLLAGCSPAAEELRESPEPEGQQIRPEPEQDLEEGLEGGEEAAGPVVYHPGRRLDPEETVEAYLEQQYIAYAGLEGVDFTCLLDMDRPANRNLLVWLDDLILRRRLILENGFCYVETERFPYTVVFLEEEELEDDRVAFWREGGYGRDQYALHFVVRGEEGKAYPPMLALNSQHTVWMQEIDGGWKITMHYFPGSVRRFQGTEALTPTGEGDMMRALWEEFRELEQPVPEEIPSFSYPYQGSLAAEYALLYAEAPNPAFYDIGDWMGNCANFISQCVWHGLSEGMELSPGEGDRMTAAWYGGEGGGSPSWENVRYFWSYITDSGQLCGRELDGAGQLVQGDIIQTLYGGPLPGGDGADGDDPGEEDGELSFNHSLIVVDGETLLLAQNSPNCFVYYSDLVNVDARYIRPTYLAW